MRVAISFVFTVALSVYLGGVLVMELVWRPAQRALPPAQVGVVCQHMGRRYRWVALVALGAVGASWVAWGILGATSVVPGRALAFAQPPVQGMAVTVAALLWASLVALVLVMGVRLHPRSHARSRGVASDVAHAETRRRRLRAMRTMEIVLRVELAMALAATVLATLAPSVHAGRLP